MANKKQRQNPPEYYHETIVSILRAKGQMSSRDLREALEAKSGRGIHVCRAAIKSAATAEPPIIKKVIAEGSGRGNYTVYSL